MDKLQGWKTYIVGAAAILTAIGGYLSGAIDLTQMITSIFSAIGAMTIRHAIATTAAVAK